MSGFRKNNREKYTNLKQAKKFRGKLKKSVYVWLWYTQLLKGM